jgi:hypothetical protein
LKACFQRVGGEGGAREQEKEGKRGDDSILHITANND